MKLSHEDLCEAWKQTGIWKMGWSWVHSWSGRVFLGGTAKAEWCEEMDERYGDDN